MNFRLWAILQQRAHTSMNKQNRLAPDLKYGVGSKCIYYDNDEHQAFQPVLYTASLSLTMQQYLMTA